MNTQNQPQPLSLAWLVMNGPTFESTLKLGKNAAERNVEREKQILEALEEGEASILEVADITGINYKTIGPTMRELVKSGRVLSRRVASNCVYSLKKVSSENF